jgi:hypothetical protein
MKPFHQGQRDFKYPKFRKTKKGYILEGNPYEENTKDYRDYEFGYNKAFYNNLDNLREGSERVSS